MDFKQLINTDVLIIGSGGAGLCAAISAKKEGAQVLVVSKGNPGRSNNTAISGGVFAVVTGSKSTNDSQELHLKDTLAAGRYINRTAMVQTMVKGAMKQTRNLVRCQVPFKKKQDNEFWIIHVPGHSVPRHVFTKKSFGVDFTIPLSKYALNSGVKFLSNVFVERLCRNNNGAIAGALVFDRNSKSPILIKSKTVVLAAGGAGQLYSQTNNAPGTTGDGYSLGFQLGIPLVDMEFVQCYPTLLFEPGLPRSMVAYEVLVFRGGARLFNSKAEDIALRHGITDPAAMTRDALTIAMAKEILSGRGINGGVWLDLTTMPADKLERYQGFIPKSQKGKMRFVVSPAVHHCMGGLSVNARGETEIGGLFAAGEVNGGVHGANRLGGNALTEAWVYGDLTGTLAALYAKNIKHTRIDENFEALDKEIGINFEKRNPIQIQNVQKEFKLIMWEKAGIIRTEQKLLELIADIERLKKMTDGAGIRKWKDFITKLEVKNMLLVGEIIARSALERQESRGAHYRIDFPDEGGTSWIKNMLVKSGSCGLELGYVPNQNYDD